MSYKIPKKIHYCWFGGQEKPQKILQFIKEWERKLPDFEIIEWNESNFDVNKIIFTKEAYEYKKFAFVSDVARLNALYEHGGIYLDTDVEVIKDLSPLLKHNSFIGCENDKYCGTATIGTVPKNPFFKKILDYYQGQNFIKEDNTLNIKPNPVIITEYIENEFNWKLENKYKDLGELVVYPVDYFCAKSGLTFETVQTDNTYTIHHFEGSWYTPKTKIKRNIIKLTAKFLGDEKTYQLMRKLKRISDR